MLELCRALRAGIRAFAVDSSRRTQYSKSLHFGVTQSPDVKTRLDQQL
jgi:hypothetical protein